MWIAAKNGNVFEVPDDQADALKVQGHGAFKAEAEARKAVKDIVKAAAEVPKATEAVSDGES